MIMFSELKVKRKSLTEEARIIRKEERKALSSARYLRAVNDSSADEARLRRRSFSQTQIERIMKHRMKNIETASGNHDYITYHSLHQHRTYNVRRAARVAHLAHAYLKGQLYHDVEVGSKLPIPKKAIEKQIRKTASLIGMEFKDGFIDDWINYKSSFHYSN